MPKPEKTSLFPTTFSTIPGQITRSTTGEQPLTNLPRATRSWNWVLRTADRYGRCRGHLCLGAQLPVNGESNRPERYIVGCPRSSYLATFLASLRTTAEPAAVPSGPRRGGRKCATVTSAASGWEPTHLAFKQSAGFNLSPIRTLFSVCTRRPVRVV